MAKKKMSLVATLDKDVGSYLSVDELANDRKFRARLKNLCKKEFYHYSKIISTAGIFDREDLEQEAWNKLLRSPPTSFDDAISKAEGHISNLRQKAQVRVGIAEGYSESELFDSDYGKYQNEAYSNYLDEDDGLSYIAPSTGKEESDIPSLSKGYATVPESERVYIKGRIWTIKVPEKVKEQVRLLLRSLE